MLVAMLRLWFMILIKVKFLFCFVDFINPFDIKPRPGCQEESFKNSLFMFISSTGPMGLAAISH